MNQDIDKITQELSQMLKSKGFKLVTAESCTGGGLSYYLTNLPGSSNWFERGFVTYSNSAKEECLGVNPEILTQFGAVSDETAKAMAEGALRHAQAEVSVAITGIAGPDGGSKDKPVGTVWIACAGISKKTLSQMNVFSGNRLNIREQSIEQAIKNLLAFLA